jgi:hypothetical protein
MARRIAPRPSCGISKSPLSPARLRSSKARGSGRRQTLSFWPAGKTSPATTPPFATRMTSGSGQVISRSRHFWDTGPHVSRRSVALRASGRAWRRRTNKFQLILCGASKTAVPARGDVRAERSLPAVVAWQPWTCCRRDVQANLRRLSRCCGSQQLRFMKGIRARTAGRCR